jgi:hypothetical protein
VASWLADGSDRLNLASAPAVRLSLASRPLTVSAPVGIEESTLALVDADEDVELVEDEEDESADDGSDVGDEPA